MTDEQWIVLARHFTGEELKEKGKRMLNTILDDKSNRGLVDLLNKIFRSSLLCDSNRKDSLN